MRTLLITLLITLSSLSYADKPTPLQGQLITIGTFVVLAGAGLSGGTIFTGSVGAIILSHYDVTPLTRHRRTRSGR